MVKFPVAAAVAALVTCAAGCAHEPEIRTPYQDDIVSYCTEHRVPKSTGIASVLTATEDIPPTVPPASEQRVEAYVKGTGGVIARFDVQTAYKTEPNGAKKPYFVPVGAQKLIMPQTAAALGIEGKYVLVHRAGIANAGLVGVDVRRVWLDVETKDGRKWLAFKSYDLQDVCNEGQRLS